MRLFPALAAVSLLAVGCAELKVAPLGDGLYGLIAWDDESVMEAQRTALRRGAEFCAARGGMLDVFTSTNRSFPIAPQPSYELVVACPPADPPASATRVSPEEAVARLRATGR